MNLIGRARSMVSIWVFVIVATLAGVSSAATSYQLAPGFNLTAVTKPLQQSYSTAKPLLNAWKASGVTAIESYDSGTGTILRTELNTSGTPTGSDFSLRENRALFVYATGSALLDLGVSATCAPLSLSAGFNLVSYACVPENYSAREMIHSLGIDSIQSISGFDTASGRWATAAVTGGTVVGRNFPVVPGAGYIVHAISAVSGWEPPVPHITSLNPPRIAVNQPTTIIEVNGDHFVNGSLVMLGDTSLITRYISTTRLAADVPTQTSTGAPLVTVKKPDPLHAGAFSIVHRPSAQNRG